MDKDFERIMDSLREALGEDVKIKAGTLGDLLKELETDCGSPDCAIHGEANPKTKPEMIINQDMLQTLDAAKALDLSVAAAASASNAISRTGLDQNKERLEWASSLQEQAFLWSRLHEQMSAAEDRVQMQKQYDDTLRASIRQELNEIYGSELTELRETNTAYRRDMQRMTDLREDDAETLRDLQTEVEGIAKQRDEYRDASIKAEAANETLQAKVSELNDKVGDLRAELEEALRGNEEARPVGDDIAFT